MESDYESTVRRAERASGRALTDHEVILFLVEEAEQMREKVKLCEAEALTEEKFTKFRETTFKGIQELYEYFSEETEERQCIFDLGELYGRLKMMEEVMNDEDKK
jgi:hypothetical protein